MNEDTLDDEVKNFSVDVEETFKVKLEDPNEFIEVKEECCLTYIWNNVWRELRGILEYLNKFPEPEIKDEEVTSDKVNVL